MDVSPVVSDEYCQVHLSRTDSSPGMNRTRVTERSVEKILKKSLIMRVFRDLEPATRR